MKNQVSTKTANKLLNKLIKLRSKKDKTDYYLHEQYCSQLFDYLVIGRVSKYKEYPNYEDLKQEGRLSLVLALRSFHADKGNFFFWADQYIKTRVKRQANRHSVFHIPIRQIKNVAPHKVLNLPVVVDCAVPADYLLEDKELSLSIRSEINKLPIEQKKVIELNAIKSYSINQISKELKMSRSDCTKLLQQAKDTLRQTLLPIQQNLNAAL